MPQETFDRSPMRIVAQHLDGGLAPGQVGVVVARPGVGKSTIVAHIGLDALLHEVSVLHVSMRDTVDHVRSYYDEIFQALARTRNLRDRAQVMVAAERRRMIHSYLDRQFTVEHLRGNLAMLKDVAHFEPKLVLVDGLEDKQVRALMAPIRALARDLDVVVWVALRSKAEEHDDLDAWLFDSADVGVKLEPDDHLLKLTVLRSRDHTATTLPARIDPTTMLVEGTAEDAGAATPLSPRPTDCTLYSGGANGAEAEFGVEAERWGVNEVNFTFEGHPQARNRGRYELSPRELAAGDVSLVYVSRRLNRTYSEGSLIRRVLQTIWHMVSRSQQVFVIGEIQDDGTVKGGTGWSVELARMWNKNLWVYDQEKKGWYRWDGSEWAPGTPVIESIHFTGTGTRYLTDDGKRAVADLFERSFGRREG